MVSGGAEPPRRKGRRLTPAAPRLEGLSFNREGTHQTAFVRRHTHAYWDSVTAQYKPWPYDETVCGDEAVSTRSQYKACTTRTRRTRSFPPMSVRPAPGCLTGCYASSGRLPARTKPWSRGPTTIAAFSAPT